MDKNQALIKLYSQCLENNFTDMTNEKHQLKAKVFATDLGLKYKKIETLFTEAKTAYEQHQIELERSAQAAKEKVDLARKREHLQKNAKLAFTAKGYHYGELKIYRCEDGSVFCKADDEDKKYTNIEITVEAGQLYFYKYHPSKTVYTGASAGGIAMGGFHTTEAHYTQRKTSTEKGSVVIRYGKKSLDVGSVTLAPDIAILFRRVPEYKANFSKNTAICRKNNKDSDKLLTMSMYARDQGTQLEIASFAADETKIPFSKCEEIADILNNIIHNKFPVQDEEIYEKAIELSKTKDIEHLGEAVKLFEYIRDYKDAGKHLGKIRPVYDNLVQEQKEQNIIQKEKKQKKKKKILIGSAIAVCVCTVIIAILNVTVMPVLKYNIAVALMESEKYKTAIAVFEKLGDYKDSKDNLNECMYNETLSLLDEGKRLEAMGVFIKLDSSYKNGDVYSSVLGKLTIKDTIAVGSGFTVGLKSDGTVVAVGSNYYGQCDISDWTDIVAVSAGVYHTVGLKSDGTVVAVGDNTLGGCNVSDWTDIVAISAGGYHTVGLKSDGTVIATEYTGNHYSGQCDVSDWTDIVAISAGDYRTTGLKSDGTVVTTSSSDEYISKLSKWTDIIATDGSVGLKSDGTVVTIANDYGPCKVSDWTNIVAVFVNNRHTIGLKSDGTADLITTNGRVPFPSDWTDIVAIAAGGSHIVGLKSDGTVVAREYKNEKIGSCECDVSDWKNIKVPGNK